MDKIFSFGIICVIAAHHRAVPIVRAPAPSIQDADKGEPSSSLERCSLPSARKMWIRQVLELFGLAHCKKPCGMLKMLYLPG